MISYFHPIKKGATFQKKPNNSICQVKSTNMYQNPLPIMDMTAQLLANLCVTVHHVSHVPERIHSSLKFIILDIDFESIIFYEQMNGEI